MTDLPLDGAWDTTPLACGRKAPGQIHVNVDLGVLALRAMARPIRAEFCNVDQGLGGDLVGFVLESVVEQGNRVGGETGHLFSQVKDRGGFIRLVERDQFLERRVATENANSTRCVPSDCTSIPNRESSSQAPGKGVVSVRQSRDVRGFDPALGLEQGKVGRGKLPSHLRCQRLGLAPDHTRDVKV